MKSFLEKWSQFIGITWIEFGVGYTWLSQTAIQTQTLIYYGEDISGFKYRVLNEVWLYTQFQIGPLGTYLSEKSFTKGLLLSSILISSGTIIKYLAGSNYWLALLGNIIAASCQAFIYPTPSTLGLRFFSQREIPFIIAIPPFFCSIGTGFGLWIPQYLMNSTTDPALIQRNLDILNWIGIFSALPSLQFIIPALRDFPEHLIENPDLSIEQTEPMAQAPKPEKNCPINPTEKFSRAKEIGFSKKYQTNGGMHWAASNLIQFTNLNSFQNLLAGSLTIGLWWMVLTVSATMMNSDYKFSGTTSSFICLVYILIGSVVATFVIEFFRDRQTLGIKISLLVCLATSLVISVVNLFFVSDASPVSGSQILSTVVFVCFCLLGITYQAQAGLFLNASVEICSPANESVVTGNIFMLSVFWSTILLEIVIGLGLYPFWVIEIILLLVGAVMWIFYSDKNSVKSIDGYWNEKLPLQHGVFEENSD